MMEAHHSPHMAMTTPPMMGGHIALGSALGGPIMNMGPPPHAAMQPPVAAITGPSIMFPTPMATSSMATIVQGSPHAQRSPSSAAPDAMALEQNSEHDEGERTEDEEEDNENDEVTTARPFQPITCTHKPSITSSSAHRLWLCLPCCRVSCRVVVSGS
jgi:hypothetical protein